MSRTIGRYIRGQGWDGKRDWPTCVARDDRSTGLRDHKYDRQTAKVSLKSDDGDALLSGRRQRYGSYEL